MGNRAAVAAGKIRPILLARAFDLKAVSLQRYMSLETIAPLSDDPIVKLPAA